MRYQSREIVNILVKDKKAIYMTKDSDPIGIMLPISTYERLGTLLEQLEDERDAAILDLAIETDKSGPMDFEEFDRQQRKKRGLPPYVQARNKK